MTESDKTYNLTVNVHSPKSSIPEILDTKELTNKFFIEKGGYKLIKQLVGKREETKFKFEFIGGQGKVLYKLMKKNEINYIFNDNDNNILNTNGEFKISTTETNKCNEGCELVMKIFVNNNLRILDTDNNNLVEVILTKSQDLTEISDGDSDTFDLSPSYQKKYIFSYDSNAIKTNNILHISTNPTQFSNPVFIYASFDENVSEDNRLFSSQNIGINELYINLNKYPDKTKLHILIKSFRKENSNVVTIRSNLIQKIYINENNPKVKFKLSHNSNVYYTVPNPITYSTILIYGIGEDWNYFDMKVQYKSSNGIIMPLNVKQIFQTGYGCIININQDWKGNDINIIVTKAIDKAIETKVEVGFEIIDQSSNYKRGVNILERVYGSTNSFETCYEMKENVDINKHPVLFINSVSQAVSFVVKKNVDNSRIYSQDGFHNSYIRLLEPFNNTNYFCIRKYISKDKENVEYGESSYDFQLYYEDELLNNQMFIQPLINGKIYTHSLNRGSIMVYRNSFYGGNSEKHIYTANLLKIRGNPKLYGYICNTYPDCKVINKEGLEEIKNINLYSINKRKDAPGYTRLNSNGEPVYETRNQYMSVVICDTEDSDPNHGECKYTIELNNESEDIQLVPGRVYATSLLPGTNYFSIRVGNYKEIRNMNISLTVLTGNAYMGVYSDFDLNYKIENYIHHKLFRKEVFEFKSVDIKEIYWGEIICTEAAFIELKYVTDFHYKGYIMTNPGEINIEYINKKSQLFPYEIINPYYYYPLNTNINKNKDYWFKIRSKECSMLYNYNYQDMPNTKSVNMQFDRSQPYTYLTSFAFMSTVDYYNYHINKDNTDCSMIIYSGEIDSNERPILIISDIEIPSDFDYTNFIISFY